MNIVLRMLQCGERLSNWEQFDETRTPSGRIGNEEVIATGIVGQITHSATVELLAREWENFTTSLRQRLTALCNERFHQPQSNTQVKMIRLLDQRLNGRVLSQIDDEVVTARTERRVIGGKIVWLDKRVDPAKAAAAAKYASGEFRQKKKKKKRK